MTSKKEEKNKKNTDEVIDSIERYLTVLVLFMFVLFVVLLYMKETGFFTTYLCMFKETNLIESMFLLFAGCIVYVKYIIHEMTSEEMDARLYYKISRMKVYIIMLYVIFEIFRFIDICVN